MADASSELLLLCGFMTGDWILRCAQDDRGKDHF
jgi:hypothetical protein